MSARGRCEKVVEKEEGRTLEAVDVVDIIVRQVGGFECRDDRCALWVVGCDDGVVLPKEVIR